MNTIDDFWCMNCCERNKQLGDRPWESYSVASASVGASPERPLIEDAYNSPNGNDCRGLAIDLAKSSRKAGLCSMS